MIEDTGCIPLQLTNNCTPSDVLTVNECEVMCLNCEKQHHVTSITLTSSDIDVLLVLPVLVFSGYGIIVIIVIVIMFLF